MLYAHWWNFSGLFFFYTSIKRKKYYFITNQFVYKLFETEIKKSKGNKTRLRKVRCWMITPDTNNWRFESMTVRTLYIYRIFWHLDPRKSQFLYHLSILISRIFGFGSITFVTDIHQRMCRDFKRRHASGGESLDVQTSSTNLRQIKVRQAL